MADVHLAEKAQKYPINKIRNIGIIAHIDAGKTTTTEAIIYLTGLRHKIGVVHEGDTVTDWMVQERERGVTIVSAAITTFWKDCRINIIDTPGHVDFTAEVERSLRVLDGAIVVLDSKMGVEAQTETVWRQADKYKVPRLFAVNKINQIGGDFYKTLESVKERLTPNAYPIVLPIGFEKTNNGWVDLVAMKAYQYNDYSDKSVKEVPVPKDMLESAKKYRTELMERVVEADDALMGKYLAEGDLSIEDFKTAIRKSTLSFDHEFFPVMGGDYRGIAVQTLMDAVVDYLPSPIEVVPAEGINPKTEEAVMCKPDPNNDFAALAFKVVTDPYVGRLVYFRVYSGTLQSGSYIYNSSKRQQERVGRLVLMYANEREEIKIVKAGEIAAAVGLKDTTTGDTLCSQDALVTLENIKFPDPVISMAVEPKTKSDQEKMGTALKKLVDEDPTFHLSTDPESGQTIISGMGEFQLEIKVDILKRDLGVDVNVGAPQVAYRETVKSEAEIEGKYIRQSGGRGQYGHVYLRLKPLGRGEGFQFVDKVVGGAIPKEYIPAVEKGVKEAMSKGVGWGYPMVDVEVTLFDGSFHEVDSSEMAFHIAASTAFQDGARKAGIQLLEPIMKIEVAAPEEFIGDVIGDLSSRRAIIEGTESRGKSQSVRAQVPLAELFGYVTRLRGLTQGRASAPYIEPSHYEVVPVNIAEKLKK
ncbi:translation elongation factor G [candidate division WWE3 bacterium RIFCSPLOWO2_01_FULL_39_13]|uniref:Elongation factor G n=1 Tax=candidate division WWE3 bacterium RIFCSPLOWO2_01_FULL_39_13 TaxID=1802624 RepID=A0A1F4V549_UNCKA|nr:MAG: translation elongation factor G [candidate division WWE3 bacterium RIFCSPLOWO2_01_FULL_39_13]